MKFLIAILFFPFLAAAQVGGNYKDFQHTEFSQFFHTKEMKSAPYEKGLMREIKIGAFQEYITIYIYTDSSLNIHEAILMADSQWVHDEKYIPLARDLVKSFLISFICFDDQKKIEPAAELIFKRKSTQDKFAVNANKVFTGKLDKYSEKLGKCTVLFENLSSGDFGYLRVKITD
jgi:hypothetical protein